MVVTYGYSGLEKQQRRRPGKSRSKHTELRVYSGALAQGEHRLSRHSRRINCLIYQRLYPTPLLPYPSLQTRHAKQTCVMLTPQTPPRN